MAVHRCKKCLKTTSNIDAPPCANDCVEFDPETVACIHWRERQPKGKGIIKCTGLTRQVPMSTSFLSAATCPRCIKLAEEEATEKENQSSDTAGE